APLIEDLDSLPQPDYSLVHGWTKSNVYALYTSRGCPYNCKFCSVIQMFGRKYRYKSVEKTLEELRCAAKINRSVKFIVDDNFAANRARTKEILQSLIEEKVKLRWSAQVRVEVAKDPELLRLMADSGCYNLYIGFESVNPDTLKAFNKSQDLKDIVECIKKVKDHGIHIHGMFVLGADTDTVGTIYKTAEFASSVGIDTVQFMNLIPLPGTPFFKEMREQKRIIHTDWSKYDGHHVVFLPKNMTPLELQLETIRAMARFYSWGYVLRNLVHLEPFYAMLGIYAKRTIKKFTEELQDYINNFNIKALQPFSP
ncbi:MAG: radical SAM protein, partial [Nitrospirae bacterium]